MIYNYITPRYEVSIINSNVLIILKAIAKAAFHTVGVFFATFAKRSPWVHSEHMATVGFRKLDKNSLTYLTLFRGKACLNCHKILKTVILLPRVTLSRIFHNYNYWQALKIQSNR